ncbi:O-methyltransferase [Pollutibacter soli]|uniref:O-methyltransferase n=1 Tax=Pollutibacter soli TaxID=3034157 RepID=UPI003013713F
MFDDSRIVLSARHLQLMEKSKALGFTMASDLYTGSLLRTIASSKPGGHFLEIGTGTGLSLSFLVGGMDESSSVISIDNSEEFQQPAVEHFKDDKRISFFCGDGGEWIQNYKGKPFDLIFADAWPGKFNLRNETIGLLVPGGFYIIDDLLPQPNWPEGHAAKVDVLIGEMQNDPRLNITMIHWSTGICIAVRK